MNNNNTKSFYDTMIPSDWSVKHLSDICQIKGRIGYRGYTVEDIVSKDQGAITMSPSNFKNGYLDYTDSTYISWFKYEESPEIQLADGDILLVKTGSTFGKSAYITNLTEKATINPQIIVIKSITIDGKYLSFVISDSIIQRQIYSTVVGGAIPTLSQENILNFKFPLPPLTEQHAIAHVLSLMDTAINTNNQLIAQKELRKKWLMQNLLTGKKRLKGFDGEWKEVKLGKLFTEIKSVNDGDDGHSIMTISSKRGLISQEDKFDRVIAGDSLKKYTQLKKEDFAYNKGNSKTYPMGCIYQLEEFESALVPFVYICFSPTSLVDSKFYKQWFLAYGLDRQLKKIITSGARGDGLLNVNKSDFFNLKTIYPPKEEQTAIAQVLQAADKEIELLKTKTEKLCEQKKGMMQVLLTGKKRLKI